MLTKNAHLLEKPRLGTLITLRSNGSPIGVPVWFEWTGELIRCFAAKDSSKIKRLETNTQASLLVANNVGETEAWIAFDGPMKIKLSGGIELAKNLAQRYWDMNNQKNQQTLAEWLSVPEAFVLLEMKPDKIREGS